jgi:Tol biopolymer transport system component
VWARNATRLGWISGRRALTTRGASAELPEIAVRKFERAVRVSDWTPDDELLVITEARQGTNDDIWLAPANGGEPRVYVQSPFNERQGVVSPDGQWLAYASDESGRFEVYVDSFPNPGRRARMTVGGGADPRWRNDGREVFFRRGTEIHAVTVALTDAMPEALSSERLFDAVSDLRAYDVSPDGQRFLLNLPERESAPRPITVIVNPPGLR